MRPAQPSQTASPRWQSSALALPELLEQSALRWSDRIAVDVPGTGSVTYGELGDLAGLAADEFGKLGVARGDRVGVCMNKSVDALGVIFGAMMSGAAYVPVDPSAPAARSAYIFTDCQVKVVVVEASLAPALQTALADAGHHPTLIVVETPGTGEGLRSALQPSHRSGRPDRSGTRPGPGDLAYILYTSGSTGKPKGVMLTHRNALSFVDWCSRIFEPSHTDRLSSHAPFHFDLSILDIYVAVKHGATLVVIPAHVSREPTGLANLIAASRISIWYSAPSILSLLAQYGKLPRHDYSHLRYVLFAGEVFPVKHLRTLQAMVPHPRYFNLYGPTETNVCTYHEIPRTIPPERSQPYPIGRVCEHLSALVIDEAGRPLNAGQEGELCITGPSVMQGYWNLPEQDRRAFLDRSDGQRWYRTGDIVIEDADGCYTYVGRRDRMVKRRGHRIELGEVEAGLYRHPAIKEAAVVAQSDEDDGVKIRAFISCHDGARLSVIELKRFCAKVLPAAMVPDEFLQQEALPKTSTDKVDYQRLQETV